MVVSNLAALGALYVALSPRVSSGLYGRMLFHPDKYPSGNYQMDEIDGVPVKEVFFPTARGRKLHGWFLKKPGSRRVLLFSHGNAGNISYRAAIARLMVQAGASVFMYDYQGYGLSEGRPSLKGICQDALAAYDHLTGSEGAGAGEVVLYGESLGAGVSCYLASRRQCAGIVLQSAFSSLRRIGGEVMPFVRIYPSWLFPKPDLDNLAFLRDEHPPVLMFHGRLDSLIPFSHAQELFELATAPKTLVPLPMAGHNDISGTEPDCFRQELGRFLVDL